MADRPQLRSHTKSWHPFSDFRECPNCLHEFPGVKSWEHVWLEVPIGDGWLAALRLAVQDGRPVISELRIFPDEPGRPNAGEWSVEKFGHEAQVPRGGLTTRKLRHVRLYDYLTRHLPNLTNFRVQWLRDAYVGKQPRTDDEVAFLPRGMTAAAERGPGGSEDAVREAFLARVAAMYVDCYRQGDRTPVMTTARRLGIGGTRPREYVRDLLNQARAQKLLTKPGAGITGGELTPKALKLLEGQQEGGTE